MKILITDSQKKFLFNDETKDLHTHFGFIKKEDIIKAKPGSILVSNKGVEFTLIEGSFIDSYRKIKRTAQIIPEKDIGLIITETGLNKQSILIESGSGSGALGCFLAAMCKKVYSYEIRKDFANIAKENAKSLGLKNYTVKNKDSKLGFNEKNADVIILDLPDPWELLNSVKKSLKIGGFLVSYSPTVPQVADFINNLDNTFIHLKTSEIIERSWEINNRKVRPRSQQIGHSGFLSFVRRIS